MEYRAKAREFLTGKLLTGEVPAVDVLADFGEWLHQPGDEYRLDQSPDGLLKRIEDYRTGYSCGYSDGKNGARMRDKDAAAQFFSIKEDV